MNTRSVCRWLGLLAVLFAPLALFAASSAPQVKTTSGIVEGKDEGKDDGAVHAFLGIPYAAPPVGDLRWKPPAAAAKWSGVRKATEFGAHCMQGRVFGDMKFRDPGGSEDCLFLNVWVPAKTFGGETAGDGLDLWRRLRGGLDFGSAAGWNASGAAGRDRREHELPAGHLRIFCASGTGEGVRAQCSGELRTARPDWRRCGGCTKILRRLAAIRGT